MLNYIFNGLLIIGLFVILGALMVASSGSQPVWMSCQERRRKYGTPKKKLTGRH